MNSVIQKLLVEYNVEEIESLFIFKVGNLDSKYNNYYSDCFYNNEDKHFIKSFSPVFNILPSSMFYSSVYNVYTKGIGVVEGKEVELYCVQLQYDTESIKLIEKLISYLQSSGSKYEIYHHEEFGVTWIKLILMI